MQESQIHRRGWLVAGLTVALGLAALQWLMDFPGSYLCGQ